MVSFVSLLSIVGIRRFMELKLTFCLDIVHRLRCSSQSYI